MRRCLMTAQKSRSTSASLLGPIFHTSKTFIKITNPLQERERGVVLLQKVHTDQNYNYGWIDADICSWIYVNTGHA